jgi:hypothetical protein
VGWFGTSEKDTVAMATTDKHDQSVLFSSEVELDVCDNLNEIDNSYPRVEMQYAFEDAGGFWKELATALPADLPDEVYIEGLLGFRDSFCDLGNQGKVTVDYVKDLADLTAQSSPEDIRAALEDAGGAWNSILENTKQKVPAEHQATFYLTIIKILNNEDKN